MAYVCILNDTRGLVALNEAGLSRLQALEVVNRWNDQQLGRWSYVLLGKGVSGKG